MMLARPNKTVGRVVLGPRLVGKDYVRIVARADGSGHMERYDRNTASWRDALESCTFTDLWAAPALVDVQHRALL
jgi:hypothetical protein